MVVVDSTGVSVTLSVLATVASSTILFVGAAAGSTTAGAAVVAPTTGVSLVASLTRSRDLLALPGRERERDLLIVLVEVGLPRQL